MKSQISIHNYTDCEIENLENYFVSPFETTLVAHQACEDDSINLYLKNGKKLLLQFSVDSHEAVFFAKSILNMVKAKQSLLKRDYSDI